MRFEGTVYRPPSEANSLLVQATIGCPHNRCIFCAMYKNTLFRIRSVEDIKQDLHTAWDYYGDSITSIFFSDGNTIIMKTNQLLDVFTYAHEIFPYLQRITVYGSARFVNRKSIEDLKQLKAAGLSRVHMGMESGDDLVLERIQKGTNSGEIIEAGKKLKTAGIEISEYYLVGIGSRERSKEHALNSAKVLNAFIPDFIRLRTLVPVPGSPLFKEYMTGAFQLLTPHEAISEIRLLIENLECNNSMVSSDHISNYCNVYGTLPQDRRSMIQTIDHYLQIDESFFIRPDPAHM